MAGFSTSVGTTGVNLTEAQFLEAKATLIGRRIKEPYVALLHPIQAFDLMADIGTTLTVGTGVDMRAGTNIQTPDATGDFGTWYGVRVLTSSAVPLANAGADRAGGMFGSNRAIGMVEKWASRLEMERDISLRAQELAGTAAYGVGELDDLAGVAIVTDA
jgi:hypothetical protein